MQSERVILLFGFQLGIFSSNFFDLGANFLDGWLFLFFREWLLSLRDFSSGKLALSTFWQ